MLKIVSKVLLANQRAPIVWSKTLLVNVCPIFLEEGSYTTRGRASALAYDIAQPCRMLADYFTKPLEGALFRKFRDVILGYKHVDSLSANMLDVVDEHSSSEERVDALEG
jgi:hypothetical protein